MDTESKYKENISKLLNEFIMQEDWQNAKLLLEKELQKYTDDHFLLTQLGEVYYEMQEYETALKYTQKAVELAPDCPLALNNHAVVLYINERNNEAIEIWEMLLNKSIDEIAHGDCNEGVKFAKSLQNDTRFRIGDAYLALNQKKKALNFYKDHLSHRQRGLFSNFTKREVENEIKELEANIE